MTNSTNTYSSLTLMLQPKGLATSVTIKVSKYIETTTTVGTYICTGCAESTGTQKGVALNRGMPHPPNFEGGIVKVFYLFSKILVFIFNINSFIRKNCTKNVF